MLENVGFRRIGVCPSDTLWYWASNLQGYCYKNELATDMLKVHRFFKISMSLEGSIKPFTILRVLHWCSLNIRMQTFFCNLSTTWGLILHALPLCSCEKTLNKVRRNIPEFQVVITGHTTVGWLLRMQLLKFIDCRVRDPDPNLFSSDQDRNLVVNKVNKVHTNIYWCIQPAYRW